MLRNLAALSFLTASLFAADFPAPFNSEKGSPMPAEEVARTMELPPGFKCQVFAAEPDVQQPIAMAWDAKGRLWVAENYTYAENPARWDTKLRDRIIILEDKDGDGKHDGRKVFWDQGSYLTSVEIGYGGAWILHNGTLSFIADKNGDDVPDGEPEILLDGFNTKTIGHNIVNGLRWGPDGWLYGRHGITDTSSVGAPGTPADKRVKFNCAIWRFHPTRKVLEAVAHGGTNSWGHDWNAEGELFMINTVIGHLWHVIPGAYFRRMFGTHLNPYVYEVIEQTADHFHWDTGSEKWSDIRTGISNKTLELGGGHAHVGMLIYQGGTWPKEYHGAMLTCNLHGNRINMDKLVREGCGYTGKHAPDFMKAKDKWFRGIDLLTGPDGNVFVADWSDTGECHDNDGVHRTSGRIYKIVYGETKKAEPFDLAKLDKDDAWKLEQEHKNNNWWSRMGRQLRLETTSGMKHVSLAGLGERLENFVPDQMQRRVINELWTTLPQPDLYTDESFPNAGQFEQRMLARLETWARVDGDGLHRLHLASALQRLPLEARWPIATALAQHEEDANDRQQPLMIWYGIEPAVAADPIKGVEFIAKTKIPTVRRLVARRIAEDIEKQPAAVDALVALMTKDAAVREDILAGMAAGLEGFSTAKKPVGWSDGALEKWIAEIPAPQNSNTPSLQSPITPSLRSLMSQLSLIFGSGRASDELIAIVKNTEGDANARRNAFTGLTRSAKPELLPVVRGLINDKVLGTAARNALAAYDDSNIPKALLNPWPQRSEEQQAATVATLVTRPSYAHALLDAVKSGQVPVAVITPYQARAIRSLNDADLTTKLTAVWGELRDTPEAKKAELADWTEKLTTERLANGEAAKGKVVFNSVCAACHKLYGEGGMIGPDLTGGDRHKLTYLLENTIDPSAIVPADYRMSVFKLKDGRTLTGVIPAQTERSITIQTPAEKLTIEKSQIAEQQQLPMSLMPEGLLTALGEENVVHLLRYLMSDRPVK
jgi:putative membrane-bound dehydrogenase-like protein